MCWKEYQKVFLSLVQNDLSRVLYLGVHLVAILALFLFLVSPEADLTQIQNLALSSAILVLFLGSPVTDPSQIQNLDLSTVILVLILVREVDDLTHGEVSLTQFENFGLPTLVLVLVLVLGLEWKLVCKR